MDALPPDQSLKPAPGPTVLPLRQALKAKPGVDAWEAATFRARDVAKKRIAVVSYVKTMMDQGIKQSRAIDLLLERFDSGVLVTDTYLAMQATAASKRPRPERSAIHKWVKDYKDKGRVGLLPGHQGRVNRPKDWWPWSMHYYNLPTKPDVSTVHRLLVEQHEFEVSYDQVLSYLRNLPGQFGKDGAARLGKNLYRLKQKPYITRTTQHLKPGDLWAADGYCADVYLAHPLTGKIWRPELTVSIDVFSRYPVCWRADEHEGTVAVQNMWAEAVHRWQHLPIELYVDNGSGHKNKLMSDELTGFYVRSGIDVIHAIPGNPHGKGWIERFFRTVRDDFLKVWRPECYCGDDMAPEALNKTYRDIQAGRFALPTYAEFAAAFNAWIERYVKRPHPESPDTTPEQLWSTLDPVAPHQSLAELKRQAVLLTVNRGRIKHYGRIYGHADLYQFNGQKLILEYDMLDDKVAVIRAQDGRLVCDAYLIAAMDVRDPNRQEEKRRKRLENQVKRGERKLEEQKARAGLVIDVDSVVDNAQTLMQPATPELPNPTPSADFSLDDFLNN